MRKHGCDRLPRTLRWMLWISLLFSSIAFAQDTQPPTTPTGFSATAASSSSVVLNWLASTDNVGVTGYQIERCQGSGCNSSFTLFDLSGSPGWANTGLAPATTYGYRVRAKDAAPNYSAFTGIVYATTDGAGDTQAPTTPTGFTATASSSTTVVLNWLASSDNVAVTGYQVERCQGSGCNSSFTPFNLTSSSPGWANTGLTASTTYGYRVRARDAVPNYSTFTSIVYVTTDGAGDTQAPSTPNGFTATASSSTAVVLNWAPSTDNVGVTGYQIERCQGSGCNSSFTPFNLTSSSPGWANTGLTASTTYGYRVRARDAVPNYSTFTSIVYVTTPSANAEVQSGQVRYVYDDAGRLRKAANRTGFVTTYRLDAAGNRSNVGVALDTTAPTAPTLSSTLVNQTTALLRWTASSDGEGAGVVEYSLERCSGTACSNFVELSRLTALEYSELGLPVNTLYRYRVRAVDGVGLWSQYSNEVSAVSDTIPPNPPEGTTATSNHPNVVNLTWTPATDPGGSGVANQLIWRCTGTNCSAGYTLIATVSGTANSYSDTTVVGDTIYHYYLTATDVAGNVSNSLTVANIRTPNPINPVLTATVPDPSTITLSWPTYVSGVVSQRVWRCMGSDCRPGYTLIATLGGSATTYSDTTSYGTNWYHYYVTGHNSAGAEISRTTVANLEVTGPDTVAPSIPQGLTANAPNGSTVNLSWSASSDNPGGSGVQSYQVQRCTGSGCTNFAALGSASSAAYGDTTVSQITTYRYRVRALDVVNNASDYSAPVTVTTPDTTPPNPPHGTTATSTHPNVVNLTWTPATDPGGSGVANQLLWRCTGTDCSAGYTMIATLSATANSHSDTTVASDTIYHYYLTATDVAGNASNSLTVANIRTPNAANPPLTATVPNPSTITLSWPIYVSSVVSQRVWRCMGSNCAPGYTLIATLGASANTYSDTAHYGSNWYHYYVTGHNSAGAEVSRTTVANLEVNGPDNLPPSIPQSLAANAPNPNTVNLSWSGSSDNQGGSGVQSYQLQRCTGSGCTDFASLGSATSAAYGDTTVSPVTTYRYRVRAVDVVGNASDFSAPVSVNTPAVPDTTPPTAPTNLVATNPNTNTVALTWVPATDSGWGVANHQVWRCTGTNCSAGYTLMATLGPSANSYSDTTVSPTTIYHYYITATDVAGNVSHHSNVANLVTDNPANPTLSGTVVNASTITLSWMGTTDSRVANARVWRCAASSCRPGYTLIATLGASANTFSDTNLVGGGVWHRYYVTFDNAAGTELFRSTVANLPPP